jgi:hypothetical protein
MSGAPTIPADLQLYKCVFHSLSQNCGVLSVMYPSSYIEDPKWQRKFTIIWASLVGVAVLASAPHLFNSIKRKRAFKGFFGISEDIQRKNYTSIAATSDEHVPDHNRRQALKPLLLLRSLLLWSLPGLRLNLGQSTFQRIA